MQDLQNCRALARAHLGPRGRKVLSAPGYIKFAKCHSGFVYVVRCPVTLRLFCNHTQDIEEASSYDILYIYIYTTSIDIYIQNLWQIP